MRARGEGRLYKRGEGEGEEGGRWKEEGGYELCWRVGDKRVGGEEGRGEMGEGG